MPGSVSVRRRCMFSRGSHHDSQPISEMSVFMSVYMRARSARIYTDINTYVRMTLAPYVQGTRTTSERTARRVTSMTQERSCVQQEGSAEKVRSSKKGKMECLTFRVFYLDGYTPLTKKPNSLRKPSSSSAITHTCQMYI